MKCDLGKICDYAKDKIAISELDLQTYISTENMLPNKQGITKSSALPKTKQTQAFIKGDILVSNIRPYFKKIWFARFNGGCSNDVLVIRAKPGINNRFLFYTLSDDRFFDYATATAKGTKMPRGDKKAILKYQVPVWDYEKQKRIAAILSALDDKIEINQKISDNLEQQAQALFKSCFVDFEPWGGQMPKDWRIGNVGEIVEIHDLKRIPLSGAQRAKMTHKLYPYYGAASLMDYVDDYIFDGKYLLLGEDGTVVDESGYPILQYVWGQFWVNNHAHILTGKLGFNVEGLYLLFKHTPVKAIVTGAVQQKISQASLRSIQIVIPAKDELCKFNNKIESMFFQIRLNEDENKVLATLRDNLLPKLISGEISTITE